MKVFLLEDHELPVINGSARIRTGNLFDPADKVGLATITGMVMRTGGTRTKSGDQLDQELENIAAGVESSIDETSGTVSFNALKEDTDSVLSTFHDVLAERRLVKFNETLNLLHRKSFRVNGNHRVRY